MKILFSPSETKRSGGTLPSLSKESLVFPYLYEKRLHILSHYETLLQKKDASLLCSLFGIKDETKALGYASSLDVLHSATLKAIERYDGVAYDYLDYIQLDKSSQEYIDTHVMIFSNLFGPLLAGDTLPEYKLQQGESLQGLKPEIFYKEYFSDAIDAWIGDEDVLDLRAGFYEKFYTLKKPYITMKFLKEGKVVSHFAKAYRGRVLKELATANVQTAKELEHIAFSGLSIYEIIQTKLKKEFIFTIH